MQLRFALPQEAAALSALAQRSRAWWGYDAAFMAACRDELTWTPAQLADPAFAFVVAASLDELLGFHALRALPEQAFELEALFVEPARIGTDLGRLLIEDARAEAARRGGRVLWIQGDPHAEPFYRAAGGILVGHRPSASIAGRPLPLFEMRLDAMVGPGHGSSGR